MLLLFLPGLCGLVYFVVLNSSDKTAESDLKAHFPLPNSFSSRSLPTHHTPPAKESYDSPHSNPRYASHNVLKLTVKQWREEREQRRQQIQRRLEEQRVQVAGFRAKIERWVAEKAAMVAELEALQRLRDGNATTIASLE
jgi:hypothetical protein